MDKSITAANVKASTRAITELCLAGVAITAGQSLHESLPASGNTPATVDLFDADGVSPANIFKGMALNNAAIGQPVLVNKADPGYEPGFTPAIGEVLIGSDTAGAIAEDADATTGWVKTVLGIGITGGKFNLAPLLSGAPMV